MVSFTRDTHLVFEWDDYLDSSVIFFSVILMQNLKFSSLVRYLEYHFNICNILSMLGFTVDHLYLS